MIGSGETYRSFIYHAIVLEPEVELHNGTYPNLIVFKFIFTLAPENTFDIDILPAFSSLYIYAIVCLWIVLFLITDLHST